MDREIGEEMNEKGWNETDGWMDRSTFTCLCGWMIT